MIRIHDYILWTVAEYLDENWQRIQASDIAPVPGWGID